MDAAIAEMITKLGTVGLVLLVGFWFTKKFFAMQDQREKDVREERIAREKQIADDSAARSALEARKLGALEDMARGISQLQGLVIANTEQTKKLRTDVERYVQHISGDLPRVSSEGR